MENINIYEEILADAARNENVSDSVFVCAGFSIFGTTSIVAKNKMSSGIQQSNMVFDLLHWGSEKFM